MDELDEFDEIILREFLADKWANFAAFCEERGADADKIYVALGGEPE